MIKATDNDLIHRKTILKGITVNPLFDVMVADFTLLDFSVLCLLLAC